MAYRTLGWFSGHTSIVSNCSFVDVKTCRTIIANIARLHICRVVRTDRSRTAGSAFIYGNSSFDFSISSVRALSLSSCIAVVILRALRRSLVSLRPSVANEAITARVSCHSCHSIVGTVEGCGARVTVCSGGSARSCSERSRRAWVRVWMPSASWAVIACRAGCLRNNSVVIICLIRIVAIVSCGTTVAGVLACISLECSSIAKHHR